MTLQEIEQALAAGRVFAKMSNDGGLWRARRNGKTRTWKTRPGHYCIPIKVGFRICGSIRHDNFESTFTVQEG
jgi:hypothetical protein